MSQAPFDHPVLLALQIAVPLEIHRLHTVSLDERIRIARSAGEQIASHGDDLLYGGEYCNQTFAALARCLAALAYQPGGVRFAGHHWEVDPPRICPE